MYLPLPHLLLLGDKITFTANKDNKIPLPVLRK
jgi:hypothetical protein